MDKTEAVRLAVAERGDAPAEDIAEFVRERYGVEIDAAFIPVIKATLRDKERLERARATRAPVTEGVPTCQREPRDTSGGARR